MSTPHPIASSRFSLPIYLLIVCAVSWPFQIISVIWAPTLPLRFGLNSLSMVMVTVGTWIAGKYVFHDHFSDAGWRWGKPRQYLYVVCLVALLWIVPALFELATGALVLPAQLIDKQVYFVAIMFFVLAFSGFGEEFGWRGYMLPRMAVTLRTPWVVILQGVIWWAWHWPLLVGDSIVSAITQAQASGSPLLPSIASSVTVILAASALPAIFHGVVVAFIWTSSRSLALATTYHLLNDGVRDTIGLTIGYPSISGLWSGAVFILLGLYLLWRGNWSNLKVQAVQPASAAEH